MKLTEILTENELLDRERERLVQKREVPDAPPTGFNVVVLNDHITPFQVAIEAVAHGARLSPDEAQRRMTEAHTRGGSVVGVYGTLDIAETVADRIMSHARSNDRHDDMRPYTNGGRGWSEPWPLHAEVRIAGEE